EGCIHISKTQNADRRRPTYALVLHIQQNDRDVLARMRANVGVDANIYSVRLAQNHSRQCYSLNYSGNKAIAVLEQLAPYLVRKRAEADAAVDYWHYCQAVKCTPK